MHFTYTKKNKNKNKSLSAIFLKFSLLCCHHPDYFNERGFQSISPTPFVLLAAKVVNTKPPRPEMAFTKSNQSGCYERIS
jgi:hypothetical protein